MPVLEIGALLGHANPLRTKFNFLEVLKMRTFSWVATVLFAGAVVVGSHACTGSDDKGNSGGSGGSDSGGKGGGSGGGGGKGGGGGNSGGSSGGVTFEKDVLPIFMAKCSPCHLKTGNSKIFHTMASEYMSAPKDSVACPGKKKGECTLERIKSGDMPQSAGCTGDPSKDGSNDKCLTQEQQDTIQAWIDNGLKEK